MTAGPLELILDSMDSIPPPPPGPVPVLLDTAAPEDHEPHACFIFMEWDRDDIVDRIDGVGICLEPGWTIRHHDRGNVFIVNENDPDRFEFALRLRRVDLAAISPSDFLRLQLLLSKCDGKDTDLRWRSIVRMSPTRWAVTAARHRRAAGLSLVGSPSRTWYSTRKIDSDTEIRRVLITSLDGRAGILVRYTDTASIEIGRDEAERIIDSIEVKNRGRRAQRKCADAIAAAMASIEVERSAEPDAFVRLACALAEGRLFDEADAAFAIARSRMKEHGSASETVGSAQLEYGAALFRAHQFAQSLEVLRGAREAGVPRGAVVTRLLLPRSS